MKAIILAAGRGSRMKEMTDDRPKCLIELKGKTLLEWQLEALRGAGIAEIAFVTGYKREMLAGRGLKEFHNSRWAETNMVASLMCASEWLEQDTCIVSYSDIFYEVSAVTSLMKTKAPIAITYDPNWLALWGKRFGDPLLDAETFRIDSDSNLVEIGNKPKSVEEIQGQYMGLLKFHPKGWNIFRKNHISNIEKNEISMTRMLQNLISDLMMSIKAVSYSESWGEIDSTEDLIVYS